MYLIGEEVTVVRYAGQLNVPAVIIRSYPEERRARVQFADGSQWTLRTDIDLVK
jgi:hypothetical protein